MNAFAGKFQASGRRALLSAVVLSLALSACNKDADESAQVGQLLAPVPADTSYLMASLKHLPDDVFEYQMQQFAPHISALLNTIKQQLAAEMADQPAELHKAEALFTLASDYWSHPDEWEQVRFVAYGNGLFPVLRAELSNPAKVLAKLNETHQQLGITPAPVSGVSGEFFSAPLGHTQLKAYYGIDGNYFVATVLPAESTAQLSQALGQTLPAQALPQAQLEQLAQQRGYNLNNIGFIDTLKVFDQVFRDEGSFPPWFQALGKDHAELDLSKLTPDCRTELHELVSMVPYADFGTRNFDKNGYSFSEFIQLRPDLAQGIQSFTGDLSGLDQDPGGEIAVAGSFRVGPLRDFILQLARNVEADPYQCADLVELNTSAEELLAQAGTPIPPFAGQIHGFKFRMDGLTQFATAAQTGTAPEPRMAATLFVENAQLLVSMAQLFLPNLADVQLPTDGTPQDLSQVIPGALLGAGENAPIHAALTNSALGLSMGSGQVEILPAMMQAQSGTTGILGSYWFDFQMLTRFQEMAIEQQGEFDPDNMALELSLDGEELSKEEIDQRIEALRKHHQMSKELAKVLFDFYSIFSRSGTWVQPQSTGVEIHQVTQFKH